MPFEWRIEGELEKNLLDTIKNYAPLASKEREIATISALCQLADNQSDLWMEEFHSRAYYNATIDWTLDQNQSPPLLVFHIHLGPTYPLEQVDFIWEDSNPFEINAEDVGIKTQEPAYPSVIYEAEEEFLHLMALKGYPLAKIVKREVIADQKSYSVRVNFFVQSGKQVVFGDTKITGNTRVRDKYIQQKIAWKEGKTFNPSKIAQTQDELEATGLFSSVVIKEGAEATSDGKIPLEIQLTEAKQRTIAGGFGYSTQQGLGLSGEWQHRNFRGMGERLDLQAKVWMDVQSGEVNYVIPDMWHTNQDLRFTAEIEHEKTKGYTETSFCLSSMLEKRVNQSTFLSYGTSYKQLRTSHSDNDGTFNILKFPFLIKWSTANDFLDPTDGITLNVKTTPAFQVGTHSYGYWVNTATGTFYRPLNENETLIFASKLTTGTILGASRKEIPPSERFYSGTENTLRGYRFMSVSPLDKNYKPIGGRSMLILSNEIRWKFSEKIGFAAFYEIGNVYANPFPDITKNQLQSVGLGLRYNTGILPIRFDIAVPLNRRAHVDPPFQFYMSIGQAF